MVKVAPVDPAIKMRVSYCRKLGGQPYGPWTNTKNDFSLFGCECVGRTVARLYRRRLKPA